MHKVPRKYMFVLLACLAVAIVAVIVWARVPGASSSGGTGSAQTPLVNDVIASTIDDAVTDAATTSDDVGDTGDSSSNGDATADDYATRVDAATKADEEAGAGSTFEAGVVLVSVKEGSTVADVEAMLASIPGVTTKEVTEADVESGLITLDVAPDCTVAEATSQLETSPLVDGAQPNYIYQASSDEDVSDLLAATSPETLAATQSAATAQASEADQTTDATSTAETSQTTDAAQTTEATPTTGAAALSAAASSVTINDPYADEQWALQSVNAYQAWATAKCDHKVAIAIIDSGALTTHEDLGNIVATYNANDGGSDVTDNMGHGTHVAGIASATTNNGVGCSGTSYNANLVVIKAAASDSQFHTTQLVAAYKYLIDNKDTYNIRVVNMSIGGEGECKSDNALLNKVDEAYNAGILTVCAAGNSGSGLSVPYAEYPGDYSTCVSVINLMQSGTSVTKNGGSNYNVDGTTESSSLTKDISAPGTNYQSTKNGSTNSYGEKTGTSMATPCVAGIAALLFAENPSLTCAQVKDALYGTAKDLGDTGWDCVYGYGEVDAAAAVTSALPISGDDAVKSGSSIALSASADGTNSWTWSSLDTSVATVDANGTVTGRAGGTATIKAVSTTDSSVVAIKTVTVFAGSLSGASNVLMGGTATYSMDCNPSGLVWKYSTSDSSVATIGETSGVLSASATGQVDVTSTCSSHPTISYTKTVTVLKNACEDILDAGSGKVVVITSSLSSACALDVAGASGDNGANVQMYTRNETPAQRLIAVFHDTGDGIGYYTLTFVASGKVLDVAGGSRKNGANVQQYDGNGTLAQRWVFLEDSKGYEIVNVGSGLSLDVAGGSSASSANLQQWTGNSTTAQRFTVRDCDAGLSCTSTYVLRSSALLSRVADVEAGSNRSGANIRLWDYNGTDAQKWSLSYNGLTGYYTLRNVNSGCVLDACGGAAWNGTNIWQYASNGTLAQCWSIYANTDGTYTLFCACNGRTVDLSAGRTARGSNIQCWDSNGTAAQRWFFSEE